MWSRKYFNSDVWVKKNGRKCVARPLEFCSTHAFYWHFSFSFLMSLFSSHQHHSIYVKLENFVLYEFSFHSIYFILISFLLKSICVSMNFHCFHRSHIQWGRLSFDTWQEIGDEKDEKEEIKNKFNCDLNPPSFKQHQHSWHWWLPLFIPMKTIVTGDMDEKLWKSNLYVTM
jgi:hypothetical protein